METLTIPEPGQLVVTQSGKCFEVTRRTKNPMGVIFLWEDETAYPLSACRLATEKDTAAIQQFELKKWVPNIGDWVCKRFFEGWLGKVVSVDLTQGAVDLIWTLDKYPSTIDIADLRPQGHPVQGR